MRAHAKGAIGHAADASADTPHAASPPVAAHVQQLQRAAGNRATTALVQRELATRPGDLDPLLGSGGKLKAAFGRSTFAAVRGALVGYRNALRNRASDAQLDALLEIEQRATEWLNAHRRTTDPLDSRRRAALTALLDEVAAEQLALGRSAAQGQYLSNVNAASGDKPFALKALTERPILRNKAARLAANDAAAAAGITEAELKAIQIFSQNDYAYINPATAANAVWLEGANKAVLKEHGKKTVVEEGTLHTGVALQGLLKLPVHTGRTYRGERRMDPDLYKVGQVIAPLSLVSTSKALDRAEYFASWDSPAKYPVRFIFEYKDHGGRDIEVMSTNPQEHEVIVLPGTRFVVESITDLPIPALYAESKKGTRWRLVKLKGPHTAAQAAPSGNAFESATDE